ncbi:hypothetical protein, partial [Odoribacter splanchnicus]
ARQPFFDQKAAGVVVVAVGIAVQDGFPPVVRKAFRYQAIFVRHRGLFQTARRVITAAYYKQQHEKNLPKSTNLTVFPGKILIA